MTDGFDEAETPVRRFGLWFGLAGGLVLWGSAPWLGPFMGLEPAAARVLAVAWVMASWWVSEALPLGLTALVPAATFPLFGVVSASEVAKGYSSPIILLLLGGFMLALAVERSGAHRRIALRVLLTVGTSPRRLVLGFGIAAAALSMWISNTATTLVMMPIAVAVAERAGDHDDAHAFSMALLLGTAYSASVGGMGTPVGTPPNLIALAAYEASGPASADLTFIRWMILALPAVVIIVPLVWWSLTRIYPRVRDDLQLGARDILQADLRALGPWRPAEIRCLALFGVVALAWVTRPDFAWSQDFVIHGWASRLGLSGVHDGTVAMLGVVVAAALPSGEVEPARLLPWSTAVRVPWGLVLLFGGGIGLSIGFQETGLSRAAGDGLSHLASWSTTGFMAAAALFCTFGTETISNTALANIVMPILAETAKAASIPITYLLVPSALACSCAFMMPAATGPNAIVFGTGRIRIPEMVRAGFLVNLVAWAVVVGCAVLSHHGWGSGL